MRDGGFLGLRGWQVLCGCLSARGAVGWGSGVALLERLGEWCEVLEAGWQVVDGVEFVSPRAIAALHRAIDLRALGWDQVEPDGALLAGSLELGHELRSAVDLDG